jgi:putative spermidine/putrescine transport system permease protein
MPAAAAAATRASIVLPWRGLLLRGAAVLVYAFMLSPVFFCIWISFYAQEIASFPPDGYSLRWYGVALARPEFARGFATSLQVSLLATAIGVPLGTAAAIAVARGRFPGREALNTLLLSPLVVPGIVAGTALYVFFIQIDNILDFQLAATLRGLVAGHVLLTIPWTVRLVAASLAGLDRAAEEAAANLGADPFTVFRRVTLPMMRPGVVAASLFSFITSFENLELSLLLVGPGRTTLPVAMLNYLNFRTDPTIMAVSALQILIVAVLMMITDRFVKLSRVV